MTLFAVVAITAGSALAHVAPSVDDNNRYLKLTPLGDRVRLAYTVFYGEVPGAAERQALDANHDGQITDAESRPFGDKLAAELAGDVDVDIDGHAQPLHWSIVDVGLGTPITGAGAFSVDMVAYLCLPSVRGSHRVRLHDRFHLAHPGETEVRFEDSPGVTIAVARVGPTADDPSFDYKFVGPGGPLQEDGIDLQFTASDKAVVTADGACVAPAAAAGGHAVRTILLIAGGVLALLALVLVLVAARYRSSAPGR